MQLQALLKSTFGFPAFRPNQEAVCRAATDGRDVLLVMPTGAGKSLCYQLPALARAGTALVVSPLIALMDDQAAKLTAAGLRVARIHSGLSREEARQACRDFLDGSLQFLFIAPERMRVPGFPEMLARRKPSLIAIDEAHCISAWGHDFRPDYRTLGDFLPALRPAPIVALTATATPTVQRDIVAQLGLSQPELFIHGFRRTNLAIEVIELSKPRRNEFTVNLLKSPANRPAIVYAPSRKAAEELASQLGGSAAAYHAGLDPATRERVQRHFLSGKLEVVVATIAFGMGIDKADVRTVVHTALPGSVEAYYQEIGRAGRDGLPSRTVLLHSFADRKMHEFFLARDYPPPTDLARVAALLTPEFQLPDLLRQRAKMDAETFDKAAEKLVAQGAAATDISGNVRATPTARETSAWRKTYDAQIAFRRSQIDRMAAYADTLQCRMASLIQHFGDTDDGLRPCGHCDFCSPQSTTAQTHRAPTPQEDRQLREILEALHPNASRSTGKLHSDLDPHSDRKQFDGYLDALARAGLLALTNDTFTNPEGREITYRKASLTHEGRTLRPAEDLGVLLKDTIVSSNPKSSSKRSSKSGRKTKDTPEPTLTSAQKQLLESLRNWRKQEAAGKPAFIVASDAVLQSIAIAEPQNLAQLRTISGIGPEKADRFGAAIIALCRNQDSAATPASPKQDPKKRPASPPLSTPKRSDEPSTSKFVHSSPAETFTRPTHTQDTTETLTPEERALDLRLRTWREAESHRIGLPQFFILGSSTLRSIVKTRPRTIPQLRTISGLAPDKIERFGASILEVTNA